MSLFKKPNQTVKKLKRLNGYCKTFVYRYKLRRWIDNYDIITCIKMILAEPNNELTIEALVNIEFQIDNTTKKMGKSMPWKAFKILLNTAIKACKNE